MRDVGSWHGFEEKGPVQGELLREGAALVEAESGNRCSIIVKECLEVPVSRPDKLTGGSRPYGIEMPRDLPYLLLLIWT